LDACVTVVLFPALNAENFTEIERLHSYWTLKRENLNDFPGFVIFPRKIQPCLQKMRQPIR